jgi:hypothetical protein
MVGLSDVVHAIIAHLRELERQLPAASPPERDRIAREIEAGEQLMDEFARDTRPTRPPRKRH